MEKDLYELFRLRQSLVQEVIDRFAEHGLDYYEALNEFNKSFPCSSHIRNNIRVVANPVKDKKVNYAG